ncbi:MAG: hypothetical protein J6J60_08985 [Clostridia bacterium]|nr:hypothetical protein [Clostridia bacterium]
MRFKKIKYVLAIVIILVSIGIFTFCNSNIIRKKEGVTKIAYWNFEDNMNKTTNSKISLAETITKSETQIAENCIAPGTEGAFEIIVNAEGSNVKLEYEIKLINEVNTPNNLYFFIKTDNTQKEFKNLVELFNNIDFSGSFEVDNEKIKVYKIFWKWPYENYNSDGSIDVNKDNEDLNYAKSNLDYIFEIEISGKQSLN